MFVKTQKEKIFFKDNIIHETKRSYSSDDSFNPIGLSIGGGDFSSSPISFFNNDNDFSGGGGDFGGGGASGDW
jgi:uncharacterized membrane protein YgcG